MDLCEFEISLVYRACSRTVRAILKLCLEKHKSKQQITKARVSRPSQEPPSYGRKVLHQVPERYLMVIANKQKNCPTLASMQPLL